MRKTFQKILDPLYGDITVSPNIDNPLFQRLGRINQLAYAKLVYPGANHTRKEHSFGAMHICSKYVNNLYREETSRKQHNSLLLAGLYHDIAHSGCSHSWDFSVYRKIYNVEKGHDVHRFKCLPYLNLEKEEISYISDVWNKKDIVNSGVLQGPVGADRMDFLQRDSFHIGIKSNLDMNNIISNSKMIETCHGKRLSYHQRAIDSILDMLNLRIEMYTNIYYNKTVISSFLLIYLAIKTASKELDFVGQTLDMDKFIYLTDEFVLSQILSSNVTEAKNYVQLLFRRKLPKLISEEKIYLTPSNKDIEIKTVKRGENNILIWTSPVMDTRFVDEFERYKIYTHNDKDEPIPLSLKIKERQKNKSIFYIQRKYLLTYF